MDTRTLQNLIAVCAQLAIVIAMAGALPSVLRMRTPGVVYWYFRTLLVAVLLLPLVQPWHGTATGLAGDRVRPFARPAPRR